MARICVLRLGHRRDRDQRVTTHVFLAARALGAEEGVLCGDRDEPVVNGLRRVSELWGGGFSVRYEEDWIGFLKLRRKEGWKVAHLTMYGEDFEEGARRIGKAKLVVVVGAGKVPRRAYELADFNLSVTSQPHSEISALALFLDRLQEGKELRRKFSGRLRIIPNKCGKVVVRGKNG